MSGQGRARRLAERLSSRDLAILASLRELRFLSAQQIGRWHVDGDQPITHGRKTRATLQRLVELGAVVRLQRRIGGIRAGSQGYVYGLSGLGQAVLDLGHEPARRHRRVIEGKPAFQDHTLAVGEMCVELVEHCRRSRAELLEVAAEPRCWRRFPGLLGQVVTLKPDAYVRLGIGSYEVSAFVEVDLDTESQPTIARKLDLYASYWRSGLEQRRHGVFPLTWWLVPDHARREAIARTIGRLTLDTRSLFTVCRFTQFAGLVTQPQLAEGGAP